MRLSLQLAVDFGISRESQAFLSVDTKLLKMEKELSVRDLALNSYRCAMSLATRFLFVERPTMELR